MRVLTNILLFIVLTILTPVLLVVTALRVNVLHTTFIKHQLDQHHVYQIAFDAVDEKINDLELDDNFPITHEEIRNLFHQVFTTAWLQDNVEMILDDVDAWLDTPIGTPLSIVISLSGPKERFISSFDALLDEKLQDISPCDPRTSSEEQGLCVFSGMSLDEVKGELAANDIKLDEFFGQLPDSIDLANPELPTFLQSSDEASSVDGGSEETTSEKNTDGLTAQSEQLTRMLDEFKRYYIIAQHIFWYLWIIYGVLFAEFIVLNAWGGWRRIVRWLGALCLTVGIIPATIGVASGYFVQQQLLPHMQISGDLPAAVQDIVPHVISDLQQAIFILPMSVGLVLVGLGLAGVIGGHWIPKQNTSFVKVATEKVKPKG